MATHPGILAWRIPWTDGAWQASAHRVSKSGTRLKRLSRHARMITSQFLEKLSRFRGHQGMMPQSLKNMHNGQFPTENRRSCGHQGHQPCRQSDSVPIQLWVYRLVWPLAGRLTMQLIGSPSKMWACHRVS